MSNVTSSGFCFCRRYRGCVSLSDDKSYHEADTRQNLHIQLAAPKHMTLHLHDWTCNMHTQINITLKVPDSGMAGATALMNTINELTQYGTVEYSTGSDGLPLSYAQMRNEFVDEIVVLLNNANRNQRHAYAYFADIRSLLEFASRLSDDMAHDIANHVESTVEDESNNLDRLWDAYNA